jgi:CheY-like chemotaxis protein
MDRSGPILANAEALPGILTAKELETFVRIDAKTIHRYVLRRILYLRMESNVCLSKHQVLRWLEERSFQPRRKGLHRAGRGQGIQTPSLAPRAPPSRLKSGSFYFAKKRNFLLCLDTPLISLLTPTPSRSRLCASHFPKKRALWFRVYLMYRPPPLRGRPVLADKRVLLIDRRQATREVRAAHLRSHGVEVHEAEELSSARFLWQPHVYDLVMLDVRRYSPGETLEFYEQIRDASPGQRFAFLLGPPSYLSRKWPGEITVDDASRGQWGETVRRFMAAA